MGYCHCNVCASWAAAPINFFSLRPPESLKVTKGEDNIATYNNTEKSYRKFCKSCGGHMFTAHPGTKLIDIYPNAVPDLKHEPAVHVFYASRTVDVKDSLPNFKDMPSEFGGSGETLPE